MTPQDIEAIERVEARIARHPDNHSVCIGTDDALALLSIAKESVGMREADEVDALRDCLLGIALSDRYRRYPKQHEDGGLRGQSGLRAVRALTGRHGSCLSDDDVVRLDKEARAALRSPDTKEKG